METIIVTRHKALVWYLVETGLIAGQEEIITGNATKEDVSGRHVIGVLPNFLAASAACVTQIPLKVPPELRGQELSIEQIREFAGEPTTFKVSVVQTPRPDKRGDS